MSGARLTAASNRVQGDTGSVAYWLKRIVVFPIGERWALIAVLAAVSNGRVALVAVVGWGVLAFGVHPRAALAAGAVDAGRRC